MPPNTVFSERQLDSGKKCVFFLKIDTFCPSSVKAADVLSWKMITRYHSKVHRTAGTLSVY